jgi:DNA-binding response OmpR family regulator
VKQTPGAGLRVLVVEDDPGIRLSLRIALEDEGYVVEEAGTGEDALTAMSASAPDVVLLDLLLPGIDGYEVCRRIRRTSDVPIVMLSARSDSLDIVSGLEAGADDYVTKPYVVQELSARLRALRRRSRRGGAADGELRIGDITIREDEWEVEVAGQPVHLTKTEFRLLAELAGHVGKALSREQLLERVWDYGYFGDNRLVDVHIWRLRNKLEHDPSEPRHLLTVRGRGYKLQP